MGNQATIQSVRGMQDLFGEQMSQWRFVEQALAKTLRAYGYEEIRTPLVENLAVFKAVGEATDVVEKQMYTLEGSKDETLALRPEGTAAFMRAVVQHQLHRGGQPGRYFYYGPMYRHERPQKGRLRQFTQLGVELINDPSPEADAEIIHLLHSFYQGLGLTQYTIGINSAGCGNCRPGYEKTLIAFLKPLADKLCGLCQKRFERAPQRVLDCKNEGCQALIKDAPKILQCLCDDCQKHHETLKTRLTQAEVPFTEDSGIVRGLDYYSRTAFEFVSDLLGAQSALSGGGRYDALGERFGKEAIPATGFALGVERLVLALEASGNLNQADQKPRYYFAALGEKAFERLYPLSLKLRGQGIATAMSYDASKSLKAQLKQANRLGAEIAVILGEQELEGGAAVLKNMEQGSQSNCSLDDLETELMKERE